MTPEHIPDIVLERYRLNELPPVERAQIAGRLDCDANLRERLAALDRSDATLGEPIDRVRARLRTTAAPRRPSWLAWAAPATAIAVVCVVIVLETPFPPPAEDRVKGNGDAGRPALTLYRRIAGGSERLADGSVAHGGDLIRIGYRAAGRPYGLIVSVDGAGVVTMHLPPTGDRAVALKSDASVLLDQAYELDEAPRWERFFFIAGNTPFDAAPVLRAARDAAHADGATPPAALALPSGLAQTGFTLQKESRR